MVPCPRTCRGRTDRFPPQGDGPGTYGNNQYSSPSHPRGCSLSGRPHAIAASVSPHARGWSRPHQELVYGTWLPTHARGWSLGRQDRARHCGASPARAGMVPLFGISGFEIRSFPRTRGDGPRRNHHMSQCCCASLACAGMVPNDESEHVQDACFPRICGDGPCSGLALMFTS